MSRFEASSFRWQGVEEKPYKQGGGWEGVARFPLAARDGFELRYFEIAPGGYSSLEKHEHAHVVIALRGRGRAGGAGARGEGPGRGRAGPVRRRRAAAARAASVGERRRRAVRLPVH